MSAPTEVLEAITHWQVVGANLDARLVLRDQLDLDARRLNALAWELQRNGR